ncbi:hypothetical protein E4U53_000451 [Claviceps sorghi]|nr:hypothetical protein E4U53_000451 [Claviceps sorghi]
MTSKRSVNMDTGKPPSLGAGLHFMRKSASHEPLGLDASPSSRATSDTGIKRGSTSVTESPSKSPNKFQRGAASDTGASKNINPSTFLVGSSAEDDVFAEGPSETAVVLSGSSKNGLLKANPSTIDAQASFIVFKRSGDPTSLAEATDLLGQLGEVAKAEFVHEDIRTTLRIPRAVLVTYKMYDNRRDPVKYFAQNQNYLVIANDPKKIPDINALALFRPTWDGGRELMEQYDKDRRSAFIGNLPLSMTEGLLHNIASSCGEVASIQLYKKMIPGGNGLKHCFGFIEFKRPDSADDLVTSMHGSDIEGHRVRVERKHSRTFTTPQRAPVQLRHVRSTIPRRRLFVDPEISSSAEGIDVTSPTGGFRASVHAMTCNPKSFSYGRGRRPRATIFNPDTSVGKALSSGDLRHAASQCVGLCQEAETQPSELAGLEASPLEKKSVEVELPEYERDGEPATQSNASGAENQAGHPATPKHETQEHMSETKPRAASPTQADCNAAFAQPPPMPWVPTYAHYGYPYMSAPMTPQGAPGMMYGGYMAPPFYGAMCDMYGNLMLSPPPMMSPYPASHAADDAPGRTEENTDMQETDTRNARE